MNCWETLNPWMFLSNPTSFFSSNIKSFLFAWCYLDVSWENPIGNSWQPMGKSTCQYTRRNDRITNIQNEKTPTTVLKHTQQNKQPGPFFSSWLTNQSLRKVSVWFYVNPFHWVAILASKTSKRFFSKLCGEDCKAASKRRLGKGDLKIQRLRWTVQELNIRNYVGMPTKSYMYSYYLW